MFDVKHEPLRRGREAFHRNGVYGHCLTRILPTDISEEAKRFGEPENQCSDPALWNLLSLDQRTLIVGGCAAYRTATFGASRHTYKVAASRYPFSRLHIVEISRELVGCQIQPRTLVHGSLRNAIISAKLKEIPEPRQKKASIPSQEKRVCSTLARMPFESPNRVLFDDSSSLSLHPHA